MTMINNNRSPDDIDENDDYGDGNNDGDGNGGVESKNNNSNISRGSSSGYSGDVVDDNENLKPEQGSGSGDDNENENDEMNLNLNHEQPQRQQQQRVSPQAASASTVAVVERNRVYMTILHYVLTYPRWSLSLFLLLAGRSLFLPSSRDAVQIPLQNVQIQIEQQSTAYQQCVGHAFSKLEYQMNAVVEKERLRNSNVRQHNLQRISNLREDATSCQTASKQSQRLLQQIVLILYSTGTGTTTTGLLLDDFFVQDVLVTAANTSAAGNNETTTTTTTSSSIEQQQQCTVDDRNTMRTLLGLNNDNVIEDNNNIDESSTESSVESLLDTYRQSTNQATLRLVRYAQNRAKYDYNYFIGLKLQSSIDLLTNFTILSPDYLLDINGDFGIDPTAIVDALVALLQRILDALRDAYVRIDLLNVRLQDFFASIDGFYVNYLDLYARLQLASDFVRDFLPANIPLPSYFDLSGIPVGDVLLPSIFEIPNLDALLLPTIDNLLSDYIREAIELIQQLLERLAKTVADAVRDALQKLLEQLRKISILEDYDPPRYVGTNANIENPSDEMEYIAELGKTTQQQTSDELMKERMGLKNVFDAVLLAGGDDGTSAASSSRPDDLLNVSSSSTFDDDGSTDNNTTFGYLEPEFPSFAIPPFITKLFTFILVYQWMIELVIQLYRIYSLKRRYEREASVDLPEIDCVDVDGDDHNNNDSAADDEKKRKQREGTIAMLQLTLLRHFMTPWMALGLLLFPFAVVGVTVWFPHVRQTCVVSQQQEGTVWGRNLISPLIINKANVAGNIMYVRAENQCNRRQRQICRTEYATTDLLYRQDLALWYETQQSLNESSHIVTNVFNKCLSNSTIVSIDNFQISNCCGLEGYTREDEDGYHSTTSDYNYCDINNVTNGGTATSTTRTCPIDNTTAASAAGSLALQQQQQQQPNSASASAFRPVSEYLNNDACHRYRTRSSRHTEHENDNDKESNLTAAAAAAAADNDALLYLEDSRFNCTVLQEACSGVAGTNADADAATAENSHRPCSDGVDDDLLRSYAIEADCQVQVYVIKCCLLVLLALYHAIIINLFTSLAFKSIKHLCWRSLTHFQHQHHEGGGGGVGGIKLRTRVSQNGELVGKGVQTANDRAKQIEKTMKQFERMGWMYAVLSIVLFLIWFISFFVLRRLLQEWNNV